MRATTPLVPPPLPRHDGLAATSDAKCKRVNGREDAGECKCLLDVGWSSPVGRLGACGGDREAYASTSDAKSWL